jgi:hypothetical protein
VAHFWGFHRKGKETARIADKSVHTTLARLSMAAKPQFFVKIRRSAGK